jgi:hypothetical protein
MMSAQTIQFLLDMLNKQIIPVNDPNFLLLANIANSAKVELEKALEESMNSE